jgi:hypothetical protein
MAMVSRSHDHILAAFSALSLAGCSGEAASSPLAASAPRIDQVEPVLGVPDRGDHPAVVAIDLAGETFCTGALVAPDVVLTARHCVSIAADAQCPASSTQTLGLRRPDSLQVRVGDDSTTAEERARGRDILAPPVDEICGADVAILMLDRPIDDIQPLAIRATGAAQGDHVRTVGFFDAPAARGVPATKLLRDHVSVLDTTKTELRVAEGACRGGGGPALDESTGEIVGVVSRADPGGDNVYTRVDGFLPLIAQALEQSGASSAGGKRKSKKGPPDIGANCSRGSECAAGACVTDGTKKYCSRRCSAHDHCPARFRCERCDAGQRRRSVWACVEN